VKHLPSGLRKFRAVIGIIVLGVRIIPAPAAIAYKLVSIHARIENGGYYTYK
jgi:hypothetical protein